MSALKDAVLGANGHDYDQDASIPPNERWLAAYDRFKNTEWGVELNRRLGLALVARLGRKVRVLDVGCGATGRFFSNLLLETSAADWEYCSVDLLPRESSHSFGMHVTGDIFDAGTVACVPGEFDVVIVDVEPHGREFEIHEALVKGGKLARMHLVVTQCIGRLTTGGPFMADGFVDALVARHRVADLLAVYDWKLTRDVYAIVDLDCAPGLLPESHNTVYGDIKRNGVKAVNASWQRWVLDAPAGWGPTPVDRQHAAFGLFVKA